MRANKLRQCNFCPLALGLAGGPAPAIFSRPCGLHSIESFPGVCQAIGDCLNAIGGRRPIDYSW